jgi:uncharacterized membrane protein HdeD (DUF308 family)
MNDNPARGLLMALIPGAILDVLGLLAILNSSLNNDSTSLYIGIGILLLGGGLMAVRLMAWQRDNVGRK